MYFTTICVQDRQCLFGEIADGKMILNNIGEMIQTIWNEIPKYYGGIKLDAFVIMPNHIHCIINIVGATPCGCPELNDCPNQCNDENILDKQIGGIGQIGNHGQQGNHGGIAPTATKMTLADIVHRFKSLTTKRYIDGVKNNNWRPFNKRLWQRNYWEHIIRDEQSHQQIIDYIVSNPLKWQDDQLYKEDILVVARKQ